MVQVLTVEDLDFPHAAQVAKITLRRTSLKTGKRTRETDDDGLQRDHQAVTAALTLPWNSGPVEGHVNRIKMLKRQMYGRAGFALLRKRVLLA